MQFFKKNQKQIVIFFLFAVLLVGVRLTIGKLQETIDNSPEANVRITSTGIDVENHQLLLDAAVPLKGWKKPALLLETEDTSTEISLTETKSGLFIGSFRVPLDQPNNFQLYLTDEGTVQKRLRDCDNAITLLPVHFRKYNLLTPKFEAGNLRNGVITSEVSDICLEGDEDGSCTVELRVYCNGILTKVAPATRDAESGLYCSERIEVPCRRGDALWLTIAYQDTQNIECEVTLGRWEITDNGDVQRKPELAQDIYPTLTWPEENNKTA